MHAELVTNIGDLVWICPAIQLTAWGDIGPATGACFKRPSSCRLMQYTEFCTLFFCYV